ncbi:hypothetical protein OU787_03380 [Kitasatospora sp. YST-16]|uniref:hypothetical protein n=1 Tax=unclassified Kitasatospora TaxID=2633591 RepID=UPI00056811E9|nr:MULTISPECIES: hypothetical protein [unclassified Kitasatospora]WAL70620.1 hypothetical protein OU787_03380 [Kitasatospora sp. YST-16]WNW36661.1 hypothetical protein RKE32_03375 [Streptomyces sp. Li-HN-5-13]
MCRRVTCKSCGKPTFAGCGMHVDQVLAGVPKAQRCSCAADAKAAKTAKAAGDAGNAGSTGGAAAPAGSWFSRLFGRS